MLTSREVKTYAPDNSLAARYWWFSPFRITVKRLELLPKYRDYLGEAKTRRKLHLLSMLILMAVTGAFFGVTYMFFRDWYPLDATTYWFMPNSWTAVLHSAWPMLLWGFGITGTVKFLTKNDPAYNKVAGEIVGHNLVTSAQAGLFEELNYRWIYFFVAFPVLQFSNWLMFGWGGRTGWIRSLNEDTLLPLADWATMHKMHDYLTVHNGLWLAPAAILFANASFRDGHKPNKKLLADKTLSQRLLMMGFPMINSWYCGMVLFFIMLHYGLLAAILVHMVYDMLIFSVEYVDARIEANTYT